MFSVLNEIKKIRGLNQLDIWYSNNNPYRILINESNGGITAYCFSCPVYRESDKELIKLQYKRSNENYYYKGINAEIEIKPDEIIYQNGYGKISLDFESLQTFNETICKDLIGNERKCLESEDFKIFPTFNGLCFIKKQAKNFYNIHLRTTKEFVYVISDNPSLIAFMHEHRFPFLTVSPMYASYDLNFRPLLAKIEEADKDYEICFFAEDNGLLGETWFCLDLYTRKSIFDTTVDNKHPNQNYAYNQIAYIGNSSGREQILYSRLDAMQFMDLNNMACESARVLLPIHKNDSNQIGIWNMSESWCSFGLTWNTRLEPAEFYKNAEKTKGYLNVDITKI